MFPCISCVERGTDLDENGFVVYPDETPRLHRVGTQLTLRLLSCEVVHHHLGRGPVMQNPREHFAVRTQYDIGHMRDGTECFRGWRRGRLAASN